MAKQVQPPKRGIKDWQRMSAVQVGAVFGVTRQAVSGWKDCPRNPDGTWNLQNVIAWKIQRAQDMAESSNSDDPTTERWRVARAEKAELEVARMKGDLVSLSSVEGKWSRVLSHIVQSFDGIGRIIAPRLVNMDTPFIAKEIRTEIHRCIETARAAMLSDSEI